MLFRSEHLLKTVRSARFQVREHVKMYYKLMILCCTHKKRRLDHISHICFPPLGNFLTYQKVRIFLFYPLVSVACQYVASGTKFCMLITEY